MTKQTALAFGCYYHIYHRGNNREPIFIKEKNYRFFLKQYIKYIEPVAFAFAYCLLNNHFHILIRTKTEKEQRNEFVTNTSEVLETSEVFKLKQPSQQFANFFNSYAKSINKAYGRTGSLFENKFGCFGMVCRQRGILQCTYLGTRRIPDSSSDF